MLFVLSILAAVAEVTSTAVTVGTAVSAGVASVGATVGTVVASLIEEVRK